MSFPPPPPLHCPNPSLVWLSCIGSSSPRTGVPRVRPSNRSSQRPRAPTRWLRSQSQCHRATRASRCAVTTPDSARTTLRASSTCASSPSTASPSCSARRSSPSPTASRSLPKRGSRPRAVALAETPGVLASVAGHPSTVRSLVSAFGDLRVADDAALARLAETSPRAASVVRCYHRFRELHRGHLRRRGPAPGRGCTRRGVGGPRGPRCAGPVPSRPPEPGRTRAHRRLRVAHVHRRRARAHRRPRRGRRDARAGRERSPDRLGDPLDSGPARLRGSAIG